MGRFVPENTIVTNILEQYGITEETALWLATPSFTENEIRERLGDIDLSTWFYHENNEWAFHANIQNENQLLENVDDKLHGSLLQLFWDRVFIDFKGEEGYHPFWTWYNSTKLSKMGADLKEKVENLIHNLESSQETLWGSNGHRLLDMMSKQTDMLVCAEDLGVVPNCVPKVLGDLGILSLKIERWARDYNQEGQPFIEVDDYPRLSVNTPSCHDTSSIRGLWEETDWGKEDYINKLGLQGCKENWLEKDTAKAIIQHNLSANSLLTIIPLQDWTSIGYELRTADAYEERINEPGSLDPHNWSWRHSYTLSELRNSTHFNDEVKNLVAKRKIRTLK
jgi:4-alpha-glucanotransferase